MTYRKYLLALAATMLQCCGPGPEEIYGSISGRDKTGHSFRSVEGGKHGRTVLLHCFGNPNDGRGTRDELLGVLTVRVVADGYPSRDLSRATYTFDGGKVLACDNVSSANYKGQK